mgnify:CR=1 FL=1
MGRWLRTRNIPRADVVIISKGGCEGQDKLWAATCGDAAKLRADLDASLARLGVEYLDAYLLHRDDPSTPVEKVVDTTGAGDVYAAAFLFGWVSGKSLKECADLGSFAGAAVIQQTGARLDQEIFSKNPNFK